MTSKLKELRELIFKCEEVKKDANNKVETLYRCNRIWDAWNIGTMTEEDFEEVEIYRDITLDHCLMAVIKRFSDCGIITKKTYHETFCEIVDSWLLGKPLQFQSPECIDSLIKLLK